MAVIHMTEAEASRDFAGVLAKARAGQEVRIGKVALTAAPAQTERRKTLSEAIRLAKERDLQVTLDDEFSRDLEAAIVNHDHAASALNVWEE